MARSRVELFEQIRRDWRAGGSSIRELAVRHHVHRRTVRQALASAVPPPRRAYPPRLRPALGPYTQVIDEWLVAALSRLLDPAEALAAAEPGELSVTASRPGGGTHALDRLWRRLGLDDVIGRCLAGRAEPGRRPDPATERVLFALVANR